MPSDSLPEQSARPSSRWLTVVCLLAAVSHIYFYLLRPEPPLSPDEQEYIALGLGLADTGELRLPTGEVAKRLPLYPTLIAAVYRWQGPDQWPGTLLAAQTVMAWCATVFLALTARRLAGRRAGIVAGAITALYSPLIFLQMSFLTEALLVFLLTGALLAYVEWGLHGRTGAARAAGLCGTSLLTGLAILTRANAVFLAPVFLADTLLRTGSAARRAGRGAMILLPALACAGLWAARNDRLLGTFTLSTSGGLNSYLGHHDGYARDPGLGGGTDYQAFDRLRQAGAGEAEADRRLYQQATAFIRANPGQTAANCLRKLVVWLRPGVREAGPLAGVIALTAAAAGGWRRWRAGRLPAPQQAVYRCILAAIVFAACCWIALLAKIRLPLTTPHDVVPLGLAALLLMGRSAGVRGLLAGLFLSQLLVAVAFIPLARLRWAVDPIFILAIAVAVSRLCGWLNLDWGVAPPAPAPDTQHPRQGTGA